MKQKVWKWTLFITSVVLAVLFLLITDTVSWRRGSLLKIYGVEAVKIESCLLQEGQTVYRSNTPEALEAVERLLLTLDWKPCRDFAQTTPYDLFLKSREADISISIDCLDSTTIRVHVDGLPAWRKDHGTYCVNEPYDIEAIKTALGNPIS